MTTTETQVPTSDESQVRAAIDTYIRAIRAKDLDAIMSCYAPDIVAYDIMPPLQYVGKDAYRPSWEHGLQMMLGDLQIEMRDLDVTVSGNIAACRALERMAMETADGRMDSWMRWTAVLKRIGGRWLIAHEHASFPLDMESNKALTDLQP